MHSELSFILDQTKIGPFISTFTNYWYSDGDIPPEAVCTSVIHREVENFFDQYVMHVNNPFGMGESEYLIYEAQDLIRESISEIRHYYPQLKLSYRNFCELRIIDPNTETFTVRFKLTNPIDLSLEKQHYVYQQLQR